MATAIASSSSVSLSQVRFAPPSERFGIGSMGMALLAHGCLIAALTWGITWRSNQPEVVTVSAELWSAVPTEAAPPPSPPVPAEVVHTPEPPTIKAPDIVIEKKNKKEILKKEPPKKELDSTAKKKEADFEHQQELATRQEQMKRMAGLAGTTGTLASTGTAKQSAGPSASYAGKVKAKIRPNIVFQDVDSVANNAAAEVDIRVAPDGTILLPPKLSKSSGNKAWDTAVLRAIEKTETLPHDTDGRVPPNMTLIMRPKE